MATNQSHIVESWSIGITAASGALSTNGVLLKSYDFVIGLTVGAGFKVAFDCHHSVTTARHANGAKVRADLVTRCPHRGSGDVPPETKREIAQKALIATIGEPGFGALVALLDDPVGRFASTRLVY